MVGTPKPLLHSHRAAGLLALIQRRQLRSYHHGCRSEQRRRAVMLNMQRVPQVSCDCEACLSLSLSLVVGVARPRLLADDSSEAFAAESRAQRKRIDRGCSGRGSHIFGAAWHQAAEIMWRDVRGGGSTRPGGTNQGGDARRAKQRC